MLAEPGDLSEGYSLPDDVRAVGALLADLLAAQETAGQDLPLRPDEVPDVLWSLVVACLNADPAARPTVAVLAQQLRNTARDLLLGVAPWPSLAETNNPRATGDPAAAASDVPAPGYVPGPNSETRPDAPPRPRSRAITIAATAMATILATIGIGFAVTSLADGGDSSANASASSKPAASSRPSSPPKSKPKTPPLRTTQPPTPSQPSAEERPLQPPSSAQSPSPVSSPTQVQPSSPKPSSQDPTVICLPSDCAARATFHTVDAHLTVCDNKGDWRAAVALYTRSDAPGEKKVWASNTAGTCTDEALDMAEGTKITYKVCIGDQSENRIDKCSEAVTNTVEKQQ
ncbi:hypothetical protein [Streptomyces sp. NPDC005407]|uniref:hypothetical protein n=1 Tax=Streptomyces sp. NPDC005407 TaxID=3155340 RepID=UPI0033A1CF45